jgi:MFS superfamily sulfate permease-like transporter
MNIGISEIIIIMINVALIIGIPIGIVWVGILLFRRIQALESRIEKLESRQDTNAEKMP